MTNDIPYRLSRCRHTCGQLPAIPMLDEVALVAWYGAAAAGDCIEYWRGYLAIDASAVASTLEPDDRRQLGRVAVRAFRLAEQGKAHLVQRRHGEADYSYLLVVRPCPQPVRARFAKAIGAKTSASSLSTPRRILEVA